MTVAADAVSALRPWFAPERPGPMIFEHVARTGHGFCRVDRLTTPHVVLAALPGNYALRGDPSGLRRADLADVVGFAEAPPEWLPALRELCPPTVAWNRVISVLPDGVPVASRPAAARLLTPAHAPALAALAPENAWIHETWGGVAGLLASGMARAAFVDGAVASIAVSFYVGGHHEDIGVVTEPAHRGRGFSTACAGALVADIRARGRIPTWSTSPDNAASLAVAARLGFVHARDDVLYAVRTPLPG